MPNTAPDSAQVHVAVGVILNAQRDVLITRRAADAHQGNLWEFPGGKVESGETVGQALERELQEELGIVVLRSVPLLSIPHQYSDKSVLLDVHVVSRFSGDPQPLEGQPMRWVAANALSDYAFPVANLPIVPALLAYLDAIEA